MSGPAQQVSQLASWLSGTGITRLELTTADGTIHLSRDPGEAATQIQPVDQSGMTVTARSVGVFHHRHPLRPGALVQPGDMVQAGTPIGLLRVGMLLLTVTAPADGTVLQHLAEDGTTVGYGTPLLRFRRSGPT